MFEPEREIYDHAAAIAREHGLPPNWLNDSVKGLLPDKTPPVEGTASFTAPAGKYGASGSH